MNALSRRLQIHLGEFLARLGIGIIYLLLSEPLRIAPRWLLLGILLLLVLPATLGQLREHPLVTHRARLIATAFTSAAIAISAGLLLLHGGRGGAAAHNLLRDGVLIWLANILAFAVWYWEIDAGRRLERHGVPYRSTDFLFPQMTLDPSDRGPWSPQFIDYLFLAFNTNTAFGPTDVLILSPRAKALMMMQSLVSLLVITGLIAPTITSI